MTKEERVLAVKNVFIEAFWSVAKTKDIEKIKVDDVVKKSGYNRATFYRYFKDLKQLTSEFEEHIIKCTIDIFKPVLIDHNYPYFYEAFVIFDKTLSNQFSVLSSYNQGLSFSSRIKEEIFKTQKGYPNFEKLDDVNKNVVVEFILGVIRNVYIFYKQCDGKYSFDELFNSTKNYLSQGLGKLRLFQN